MNKIPAYGEMLEPSGSPPAHKPRDGNEREEEKIVVAQVNGLEAGLTNQACKLAR